MTVAPVQPLELFRLLMRHRVDYIVVGGMAAVLQGAPIQTFDLDIVHARTEENVQRLLEALQTIDAHARTRPDRKIAPGPSHLLGTGHVLLSTALGPLDVLCTLDPNAGYAELLPDSVAIDVAGMSVRVLGLRRLIAVKRAAGRPKDLAVLPILQATLDEDGKGGS